MDDLLMKSLFLLCDFFKAQEASWKKKTKNKKQE